MTREAGGVVVAKHVAARRLVLVDPEKHEVFWQRGQDAVHSPTVQCQTQGQKLRKLRDACGPPNELMLRDCQIERRELASALERPFIVSESSETRVKCQSSKLRSEVDSKLYQFDTCHATQAELEMRQRLELAQKVADYHHLVIGSHPRTSPRWFE